MDARFRNKMHSDFFATPPRQIRNPGITRKKASAEYTPNLNFFSYEYKSGTYRLWARSFKCEFLGVNQF